MSSSRAKSLEIQGVERSARYASAYLPAYLPAGHYDKLTQYIASASREIRRQIELLIDRRGHRTCRRWRHLQAIFANLVANGQGMIDSEVSALCTHIQGEALTRDDLTDLSLLQLDIVAVLQVDDDGRARSISWRTSYLLGQGLSAGGLRPIPFRLRPRLCRVYGDLGGKLATLSTNPVSGQTSSERRGPRRNRCAGQLDPDESIGELELARTAGIDLVEVIIQKRRTRVSSSGEKVGRFASSVHATGGRPNCL